MADGPKNVIRYTGGPSVPKNVIRRRKYNLGAMRRVGSPVIIKHMYNDQDVQNGIAKKTPNFSSVYGQTRHNDPISHGVGFVSVETSPDEWVSPDGRLVTGTTSSPGAGYTPAPKYRGYGPGYLTYVLMPDVSEDVFKVTETGAFLRVQQAQVQMGWYPDANDNDLLIVVEIDNAENVVAEHERFLLKQSNPVSMRGLDRQGRREYGEDFGNRHIIDQNFELTLIPHNDELYRVEIDR